MLTEWPFNTPALRSLDRSVPGLYIPDKRIALHNMPWDESLP
jgi:hypothetical protein